MRNPPTNLNDSYWKGIQKATGSDAAGNRIRPLFAPPPPNPKTMAGTPLPGGGCYYENPNGGSVTRQDVDCEGNPTQAAIFHKGGGQPPAAGPLAAGHPMNWSKPASGNTPAGPLAAGSPPNGYATARGNTPGRPPR